MCALIQPSLAMLNIAAIVLTALSAFTLLRAGYILILGWGDRETYFYVQKIIIWALLGFAAAFILGSADKVVGWFESGASLLASCGIS